MFVSQGSRTTLSRRGRAWVPDAPCATLSRYDLPASLVLALVLAHDHHPYPSSSRLFPLAYSRSRRTSMLSQRGPTPCDVSSFALTTFARREQCRTSRRHSNLFSLLGRTGTIMICWPGPPCRIAGHRWDPGIEEWKPRILPFVDLRGRQRHEEKEEMIPLSQSQKCCVCKRYFYFYFIALRCVAANAWCYHSSCSLIVWLI